MFVRPRDLWPLFGLCCESCIFLTLSCSVSPQTTRQRRRISSRAQSAAERSSTMSMRRSNWWRTYWWETHNPSLNTLLCLDWAPIGVWWIHFETSEGLCLLDYFYFRARLSSVWPPHLCFFCSQTLKDYQRRLDTSGLKPSNELYTEYKVKFLSTVLVCTHFLTSQIWGFFFYVFVERNFLIILPLPF